MNSNIGRAKITTPMQQIWILTHGEREGLGWSHPTIWNQPRDPKLLAELLLQTDSHQLYVYFLEPHPTKRKDSRNI